MTKTGRRALARWMRESGWTQARVGAYIGTTQPTISRILDGHQPVSVETALRLNELTEIPVDELVTEPGALAMLKKWGARSSDGGANAR